MAFDSYGSASRNGDTEYMRLSNTVSNNIQQLTRNVAAIQRMVNQIGTSSDVPELFDRLQHEQKEGNRIAKDTSMKLKQLSTISSGNPAESRQRKIQQDKLQENFTNCLQNFQKAQRLAAEKERASVQRARAASEGRGSFMQDHEHQDTSPIKQAGAPQMQAQAEAELSLDMIREREEGIRQLESDIMDVNEIFKDLAIMVHEQGEVIDSIEANVDNAATHVETANVQLEKARHYQKASRRKLCIILIISLLGLLAVGLIIYFSVK